MDDHVSASSKRALFVIFKGKKSKYHHGMCSIRTPNSLCQKSYIGHAFRKTSTAISDWLALDSVFKRCIISLTYIISKIQPMLPVRLPSLLPPMSLLLSQSRSLVEPLRSCAIRNFGASVLFSAMLLLGGVLQAQECPDFSILSIDAVQPVEQSSKGKLMIHIAEAMPSIRYDVLYLYGEKETPGVIEDVAAENGVIRLSSMRAGRYTMLSVRRRQDGCVASSRATYQLLAPQGEPDLQRSVESGCGSGSLSYTDCRGASITINKSNLSPNTYIYTNPSYLGSISYVNANCQVTDCQAVYCLDLSKSEPTPGAGYPYGTVTFSVVNGHQAAGLTELQAERINWINCNIGSNTEKTVNDAIWCIMGSSSKCNALSNAAINAVPSVQGGISSQMKFYLPSNSNIQRFVAKTCVTPGPTLPVPDDSFAYDCDDGVLINDYGVGANCSSTPDASVSIPNTSNVFQVVVEVVYKGTNPGSSIAITAGGQVFSLAKVSVSGTSTNVHVYRGLIVGNPSTIEHNSATGQCGSGNGLQSLVAYAFRTTTIKQASSVQFTSISGFCDLKSFTLPIPTDSGPRNVTVTLPISELTTDNRFLTVKVSAAGIIASTTIYGPDGLCCLATPSLTLPNVPGSANQVLVEIDTRSSSNPGGGAGGCGQSWVIAGLAYADVQCACFVEITMQPSGTSICPGQAHVLEAMATVSSGTPTYQWQQLATGSSWVNISGANNSSYTTPPLNETRFYRVVVGSTDSFCDDVISDAVSVSVQSDCDPPNGDSCDLEDESYAICEGEALAANVSDNDTHTGSAEYALVSGPSGGDFAFNPDGSFTFSNAAAGSYSFVYELCVEALLDEIPPVVCTKIKEMTVIYQGPSGVNVQVTNNNSSTTFAVFSNVQNGDVLTIVNNTGFYVGQNNNWKFFVNGNFNTTIHTSCSVPILGLTFGDFYVAGFVTPEGDVNTMFTEECCQATATINVSKVEAGISGDSAFCPQGEVVLTATATGGTQPYIFSWSNGLGSEAVQTVSPTGATTYTVTATDANDCAGTASFTVTPNEVDPGQIGEDQSVCVGGIPSNLTPVTPATGTGDLSFQWQISTEGCGGAFADIPGATAASYNVPSGLMQTTHFRRVATSTLDGVACSAVSNCVAITVVPAPDVAISADTEDICEGGTAVLTATPSGGIDCDEVQWETRLGTSGSWSNAGTGNALATPASLAPGTYQYRALYNCSGVNCEDAISNVITLTVNDELSVSITPTAATLCVGGTTTLVANVSGGAGSCAIQWQSSPNGQTEWAAIGGATGPNYVPASDIPGATYYRAVYECDAEACNTATSNAALVVVIQDPSIEINPPTNTVCVDGDLTLLATLNGGAGNCVVQWQSSDNGLDWTDVSGANTIAFNPPTDSEGITFYRATYTCDGSGCDQASSNVAAVQVEPGPQVQIDPLNTNVCVDANVVLNLTVSGGAGVCSIQWQSSPDNNIWADINGATANSYAPSTENNGTFYYRAVYNCTGGGCTEAVSNVITLVVAPDPAISITADVTETCTNSETAMLSANTSGGLDCQDVIWESRPAGTIVWSQVGTGPAYTTPAGLAPADYQYRARYICNGLGCDDAASNIITITVTPTGSIGQFVWEDLNANGLQDPDEPGIAGVTVRLLDSNGNFLQDTDTDGMGFYLFEDLCAGDYILEFASPSGFLPTVQLNTDGKDLLDSDADLSTGRTGLIPLVPGENDLTNDAGFYGAEPAIELVKTGTYVDNAPMGIYNPGDEITYTFTVTNTGNTRLTNVTISDPLITVSGDPITLDPGQSDNATFTGTYTLTQTDINNSSFTNIATVTGTPPVGDDVDDSDDDTQFFQQDPSIALTKSADPQTYSAEGDQITYTFTVENDGNVTLTGVTVTDPLFNLSFGPATLAPGASETYTYVYTVTQADVDAGSIYNVATATGKTRTMTRSRTKTTRRSLPSKTRRSP
jgi:uncharacterized repeat protein (TIGR01451 family)